MDGNIPKEFESPDALWTVIEQAVQGKPLGSPLSALENDAVLLKIAAHVQSTKDTRFSNYFLQFCNIFLVENDQFFQSFREFSASEPLCRDIFSSAFDYKTKLTPLLNLVFNYWARVAKVEAPALPKLLQSSQAFHFLIGQLFDPKAVCADSDTALEFFLYIRRLVLDTLPNFSLIQLLSAVLSPPTFLNFLNMVQISLDGLVSNRHVYSVVRNLGAIPLETDEDFSTRISPSDSTKYFELTITDVVFLVDHITSLLIRFQSLSEAEFGLANEMLAILINATFVGGYNKALQQLVGDGGPHRKGSFHFLGSISEGITLMTKLRFERKREVFEAELASNIIRMASNLVHTNTGAQEFLLDHEYLPFYLSNSVRDEANPHAKELLVVFIRYMTESNHRARGMISALSCADFIKENASLVNKFESL
jgi:hypothetical protein